MDNRHIERTYIVGGLDQVLYSEPPAWPEGSFEQSEEDWGRLRLRSPPLHNRAEVGPALEVLDSIAERFRIALSMRTGCPLTMRVDSTSTPIFPDDPGGIVLDGLTVTATASARVAPRPPPATIEQLPEAAARWVQTLAETRAFSTHPDECMKRYYLLIEELKPDYGELLTDAERTAAEQVKWVRDFVSHEACGNRALCDFVLGQLPDSRIPGDTLQVRFDRTLVEHRNFVGRFDPVARQLVSTLLMAAIADAEASRQFDLPPSEIES